MKAVVVTKHLYGYGGGAQAVLAHLWALRELGYAVTVFSRSLIPPGLARELAGMGVEYAPYYQGCSLHADLLLNIDHFVYERPLAKLNLAHVFHPHAQNRVPAGYQRVSGTSDFTRDWIRREWGPDLPYEPVTLYPPIREHFYQGRKQNRILHVSRLVPPTEYADKGHIEMIRAFRWLCDSGLADWTLVLAGANEAPDYVNVLAAQAHGYPIRFVLDPEDPELADLYATSAIYWHATGISMPEVHGAQEHLGLTTLEAMASGCVPVVYGSGGQPEIITHGQNGFLCRSWRDMAEHTAELAGNLSGWSALSQQARRSAQPWSDWSAFRERMAAWIAGRPIPELALAAGTMQTYTPADVAVIIPAHNGAAYTLHLLKSLLQTEPGVGRIVVIDNASSDGTSQAVWQYLREEQDAVMISDENLGFARALNKAAGLCPNQELLLALNNDMVCIEPGWLQSLLDALTPDVGVVGAKLIFPDGRLQHAGGLLDFNRPDLGYHRWYAQADHAGANQLEPMPYVTGACLLARRELWRWPEWGGLNYEDVGLCLEAFQQGYRTLYQPAARLVHYGGATKAQVSDAQDGGPQTQTNHAAFLAQWQPLLLGPYGFYYRLNQALAKELV